MHTNKYKRKPTFDSTVFDIAYGYLDNKIIIFICCKPKLRWYPTSCVPGGGGGTQLFFR